MVRCRRSRVLPIVVLGLISLGACRDGSNPRPPGGRIASTPETRSDSPPAHPGRVRDLLRGSRQALVVRTPTWTSVRGTLQRYERGPAGTWRATGPTVPVVVGRGGLAWGRGEHAIPADGNRRKREGDGRAPAGVFTLGTSFGYAPQASTRSLRLPYLPLTPTLRCVDDPKSRHYNRVVDAARVARDWRSAEAMRRDDHLYRWGLVIRHNTTPITPGAGSCVFLHVWRSANRGTAGCTALPRTAIRSLLGWLVAAARPVLIQLPASQYRRWRTAWKLP